MAASSPLLDLPSDLNDAECKDYEFLTDTSEAMIYLAMIRLMLRRLTGKKPAEIGRKRPEKVSKRNLKT